MGCDGGSIPRREELCKMKEKPKKADPNELERIKWTSCALSKEQLKPPIVCCQLGGLFNKEALVKALLDKSLPREFKYIRSLKDVLPVNFAPNPNFNSKSEKMSADLSDLGSDSPFICPITGIIVGGKNSKFCVLKTCACVLSEKALKECPSETCLVCTKHFTQDDIFELNPEEDQIKLLKESLEQKKKEKKQLIEKSKEGKGTQMREGTKGKEEKGVMKEERGTKRKAEESSFGKESISGSVDVTLTKPKKPTPASAPVHSNKSVYASLFTSSLKSDSTKKESFLCRNVARG